MPARQPQKDDPLAGLGCESCPGCQSKPIIDALAARSARPNATLRTSPRLSDDHDTPARMPSQHACTRRHAQKRRRLPRITPAQDTTLAPQLPTRSHTEANQARGLKPKRRHGRGRAHANMRHCPRTRTTPTRTPAQRRARFAAGTVHLQTQHITAALPRLAYAPCRENRRKAQIPGQRARLAHRNTQQQ